MYFLYVFAFGRDLGKASFLKDVSSEISDSGRRGIQGTLRMCAQNGLQKRIPKKIRTNNYLSSVLGPFLFSWGALGAVLLTFGASWAFLGASWASLGALWVILGVFGSISGDFGSILGVLKGFLGDFSGCWNFQPINRQIPEAIRGGGLSPIMY